MLIDKKLSKCLVITNYRTGSTSFCIENGRKNNLINLFELLNDKNSYKDIDEASKVLEYTDNFIVKVMPDQFAYNYANLEQIMKHCDQVVYLYRKDFKAQCLSWIAMQHLQDWNVKPQEKSQYAVNHIVDIDQAFADTHSKLIRDNNDFIKECIKRYPAPVYAYEDINNGKPYKRSYDWKYMPFIKDYNTKEIYNETII